MPPHMDRYDKSKDIMNWAVEKLQQEACPQKLIHIILDAAEQLAALGWTRVNTWELK